MAEFRVQEITRDSIIELQTVDVGIFGENDQVVAQPGLISYFVNDSAATVDVTIQPTVDPIPNSDAGALDLPTLTQSIPTGEAVLLAIPSDYWGLANLLQFNYNDGADLTNVSAAMMIVDQRGGTGGVTLPS